MEWTTSKGRTVKVARTKVHVTYPDSKPATRELDKAEVFLRPSALWIDDMDVLVELFVALAAQIEPDELEDPLARKRLDFWRAIDPEAPRAWSSTFVETFGSYEWEVTLKVDGMVVTRESDDSMGYARQMLLDEAFFYGPRAFGAGAELREGLCDLVLGALPEGSGITRQDAYPEVDYGALEKRSWTYGERSDGESYVFVDGAVVVAGYQYQRDMGSSRYPVERVITGANSVHLGPPKAIRDEVLAYLRSAVR